MGILAFFLFAAPLLARPEVYFSSEGAVQPHLVNAIDGCHESLDIAMFDLTARPLLQALRRAAERGVRVRIVLDRHIAEDPRHAGELAGLTKVEFRTLAGQQDNRKGLMHNKFAVFDHRLVETGSYNWTHGAETKNFENALFEDDPEMIRAYARQFEYLWMQGRSFSPSPARRSHFPKKHSKRWP